MGTRETIPVLTTFGFPGDGTFNLRFPPDYRDEIRALLDEVGLEHGTIIELSAGTELAIEAVKVFSAVPAAGGLVALAQFYRAFTRRHHDKRVVFRNGPIQEVNGMSRKDIEALLEKVAEEQHDRDQQSPLTQRDIEKREPDDQD